MSELPSITVVTACLDAAATIGECLESVRSQDHPAVEHVVVDGGSTDGTLELLAAAEGITWISEPDGGRPDAASKGVRISSGEIVAWLTPTTATSPARCAQSARRWQPTPAPHGRRATAGSSTRPGTRSASR